MRYFFVFLLPLLGCEYLQPKEVEEARVIARVGQEKLTFDDIRGIIPTDLGDQDSAAFIDKIVDDWIKKQLMIQEAKDEIDFNEAEIQKKVLDYRYALMVHEFEQKFVENNLVTDVSDQEIRLYYETRSENFVLRQNLVKCIYIMLPNNAPGLSRFRNSFTRATTKEIDLDYVDEYAVKSFLEDSIWVDFDEVLKETPMEDVNDRKAFLQNNATVIVPDEDFTYFLLIQEYKLIGEIAPLDYVKQQIKDIITSKRKVLLKKELERNIYEEAKRTGQFEVFY